MFREGRREGERLCWEMFKGALSGLGNWLLVRAGPG